MAEKDYSSFALPKGFAFASQIKRAPIEPPARGFNLVFENESIYDLDNLVAKRSRNSGEGMLSLEVKDLAALEPLIIEEVINSMEGDNISNYIAQLIPEVCQEYDTPINRLDDGGLLDIISERLTDYLHNLSQEYEGIDFYLTINPNSEGEEYSVVINFNFSAKTDAELMAVLSKYYEKYREQLADFTHVDEGGLAVLKENTADRKTRITADDYRKYLLGGYRKKKKYYHVYVYDGETYFPWKPYP